MPKNRQRHTQAGYVLVTTILLLALVTVVVFSAMRTSAIELQISANELIHQRAFFLAEAGIAHAVAILTPLFEQANAPEVRSGPDPSWDFAFRGPDRTAGTDDDARGQDQQPGSFEGGARWLDVRQSNGTRYAVTLWNNTEDGAGGDYDTDRDGRLWLRSEAVGPRGGRASIQVLLHGFAEGGQPVGYPAQAGGGGGNSNSGIDRDPIVDFDLQLAPGADQSVGGPL